MSRHKEAKEPPQVQNFAVKHMRSTLFWILASTAGTQPALCVGTTKRQFVFFSRLEFHFLLVLDSRGKSKKAE